MNIFIKRFFLTTLVILCGCDAQYHLQVRNNSGLPVKIERIYINADKQFIVRKIIQPTESNKYTIPAITQYFTYDATQLRTITAIISAPNSDSSETSITCAVNDYYLKGCRLPLTLISTKKANCICDSYNDFY